MENELKFTYEEIQSRYEQFVNNFLNGEENVTREEILPRLWIVEVPNKNFKVSIT